MTVKFLFSETFKYSKEVIFFIKEFNSALGTVFLKGKRNEIKLFDLNGEKINIKSFKVPHFINKIAYRYFRKSKARRSFEFANILLAKGIGTPTPIAYYENHSWMGLNESYYVSQHFESDLTFRELVEISNYPDKENILRQFIKFTFSLHEKGIEFLDHSPGNTLIKKNQSGEYDFYLVDLNRMKFHNKLSLDQRIFNLRRLSYKKEMVREMSYEYAKLYNVDGELFFKKLWNVTQK